MPAKTDTVHPKVDAFQSDDDHPTVTFCSADETLALPYHLVRSLRLGRGEKSILVEYDDYEITINGQNLTRLWRDLRAFRAKEVVVNGGATAKAVGGQIDRCLTESIVIERADSGEQ